MTSTRSGRASRKAATARSVSQATRAAARSMPAFCGSSRRALFRSFMAGVEYASYVYTVTSKPCCAQAAAMERWYPWKAGETSRRRSTRRPGAPPAGAGRV